MHGALSRHIATARELCQGVLQALGMEGRVLRQPRGLEAAAWFVCLAMEGREVPPWVLHITISLLWPGHTAILHISQQPLSDGPASCRGVAPAVLCPAV